MRDVACLPDVSTNAYCYVEALRNHATDLYFYTLPFGIALPNSTLPSCSPCLKSVMSLYSQWQNLTALNEVYDAAAQISNNACDNGFAMVTGAVSPAGRVDVPLIAFMAMLFCVSWLLG